MPATRALSIDPTLGEAEASLALISCLHDWDWEKAGNHYRRAMELNPELCDGVFLVRAGLSCASRPFSRSAAGGQDCDSIGPALVAPA